MKAFKLALVLLIIIFPLNFNNELKVSSADGVSNYSISQSITYQVKINFSLTHLSGPAGDYFFKFSRLNDRQPNSALTQFCGPYQESELQYSSIIGSNNDTFIYRDRFNNTYDMFNGTSLSPNETITLNQQYEVTLNEVFFNDVNPSEIGEYDTSDEMFSLYCNNSELYYERDDFNINATSYSIVNPSDNPVVKAQKINDWVNDHLVYSDTLPNGTQEMGAKWAFNNQLGDCSEYSSLMITLLRCQGIPARKVTGFVITNNPSLIPQVGQEWSFYTRSNGQTNLLGHAWVEYYVPNIGWIACDPTWDETGDYFNYIDYFHLNLNIGAWFSIPGLPDESEFPHPCIVYMLSSTFDYEYNLHLKVISTGINVTEIIVIIVIVSIVGVVIIGVTLLIRSNRKKRKEYEQFSSY